MRLTSRERAERQEAFRRMNTGEKLDYVFTYYKLPILLTLLFLYALCYGAYRYFTDREVLLYAACVNVAAGEDTEAVLSEEFIRFIGGDTRKEEISIYHDLYLSDDPAPANQEYAYASRVKLMASVNAERLDVVLMNREAYDLLSADGYLLDLTAFFAEHGTELRQKLRPYLTENRVLSEERAGGEDENRTEARHAAVQQVNGVEITSFPAFQSLGFTDEVFLGVIRNSPRPDAAAAYLAYLASALPSRGT